MHDLHQHALTHAPNTCTTPTHAPNTCLQVYQAEGLGDGRDQAASTGGRATDLPTREHTLACERQRDRAHTQATATELRTGAARHGKIFKKPQQLGIIQAKSWARARDAARYGMLAFRRVF
jgi:hypothetical protein